MAMASHHVGHQSLGWVPSDNEASLVAAGLEDNPLVEVLGLVDHLAEGTSEGSSLALEDAVQGELEACIVVVLHQAAVLVVAESG